MTMLLVNPQEVQPHTYYMNYRLATTSAPTVHNILNMPPQPEERQQQSSAFSSSYSNTVAQALEIARESPDGAMDPTVSSILENALVQIWGKVQAHPTSYVMTRDEFAVFNYFQHRFEGDKVATAARSRYWDNTKGENTKGA
jgi:hypothetical protein